VFSKFPFLRILIAFLPGLLCGHNANDFNIVALLINSLLLLRYEKNHTLSKWKYRKQLGILIHLQIFLLGLNTNTFKPDSTPVFSSEEFYLIHLEELNNTGKNYNRFKANLYTHNKKRFTKKSKIYVYVSTSIDQLNTGDVLMTKRPPAQIHSVQNPGGFDFGAFAKRDGILHTLFINKTEEIVRLGHHQHIVRLILNNTRKWIINTVQTHIKDPVESGLTEALLIGYKEDLDLTLQEKYTETGVSHIIAVSGMHLGLIFYVLHAILSLVVTRNTSRYISFCIILPLLWIFAFVTGASASVMRSVLVFTLILLGNLFRKKTDSINVLLASAFFLLVIHPGIINDIGFQLSYAAVLSILIYEPFISKWVYTNNKALTYLWNMVSITLAAQILTTPIVLFHFKQFPLLFLITNMVAVPLSSIVLLLAIALCATSLFLLPTASLAMAIHFCLALMNSYIEKIASIDFNTIQLSTSLSTSVCLYLLIITITVAALNRNSISILAVLLSLNTIFSIYAIEQYQLLKTKQLLYLNFKGETCIIHQHGKNAMVFVSSGFLNNRQLLKKQMKTFRNELGIEHWQIQPLLNQPAIIEYVSQEKSNRFIHLSRLTNTISNLRQLPAALTDSVLILADGSNKLWKIKQWEKQAQELNLRLHSIPEKGAFIIPCHHHYKRP
jgi:competence protein ComEC